MPNAAALLGVLAESLEVRGTVVKQRRLLIWNEVRIHLDDVEGLGTFIELEAVAAPSSDLEREYALIADLRRVLDITDDRLMALGYAAQLLTADRCAPRW